MATEQGGKAFLDAGAAAFIELCCGPLYILAKVQHQDNVVSVSEAAATMAKGGLTLALLRYSSVPVAIALSWAQVLDRATVTHTTWTVYCVTSNQ